VRGFGPAREVRLGLGQRLSQTAHCERRGQAKRGE